MCGVAGYVGPARTVKVDVLLQALANRGPDGQGAVEWTAPTGTAVLVHRRLAIQDLSAASAQPFVRGGHALAFNGEIFNHAALRARLEAQGHVFDTTGDAEVLHRGLVVEGPAFLDHVHGPFALALVDRVAQTLLLARDRLGVNPLYVAGVPGGGVSFSSTTEALARAGLCGDRLDVRGLCGLLFYGSVPEPLTLTQGVTELEPGTWRRLGFDGREQTRRRYWRLPPETPGLHNAVGEVRNALHGAVSAELVSDTPVAVLLSSGLDSAAVAALAARESRGVEAFTVGFAQVGDAVDERALAAETAGWLGVPHRCVDADVANGARALTAALHAQDLPSMDGVNTHLVCGALVRAGYKVALSGLGGDELFLGYNNRRNFHRMVSVPALRAPASWARAAGGLAALGVTTKVERAVHAALRLRGHAGAYAAVRCIAGPATVLSMVHPDLRSALQAEDLDPVGFLETTALPADPDGALSRLELCNYLRSTLLKDGNQLSLAHGLELRVPMMDWRLVETVLRVPGAVRAAGAPPKPLMRAALEGVLPPGVEKRPKVGFVLPLRQWLDASGMGRAQVGGGLLAPGASGGGLPQAMVVAALEAWSRRRAPVA